MKNKHIRRNLFVIICILLGLSSKLNAGENIVRHYLEANSSSNLIFIGGDQLNNQDSFATGFHISHGSNITPMHAIVLSYGKDYVKNSDDVLTSKAFFLRRFIPALSSSHFSSFFVIGSGSYSYEKSDTLGELASAGIIIGYGFDYLFSQNLRLSLEVDYRGFTVKQFGASSENYVRPVTLFAGLKYYYKTSYY